MCARAVVHVSAGSPGPIDGCDNRLVTAAPIWSLLRRSMTRAGAQAAVAVLGLLAGGVCHLAGAADAGDVLWQVTIVVTVVPVTWEVVHGMVHGDFGVDIIALLAMVAALLGGELLAGAIVAVMLRQRDLTALLRRAPGAAGRQAPRRSCCAWPRRSTSAPRTSWPRGSSTTR